MGFNFSSFIGSVWFTIIMLSILVVVHEFGHFILARLFGVKVYEFSVGFGPLIGKFKWRDVQYSFRWLLLGGFVKIAGMDIALEGDSKETEESGKTFLDLSLMQKIAVIAAGPIFNLFLTVILAFVAFAFVGSPYSVKSDAPILEQASPGSPAFNAGLMPGDRILSINGEPVNKWGDISALIQKYNGEVLDIKILRENKELTKKITPIYSEADKKYIVGINPVFLYKRAPVLEAAKIAISYPWDFSRMLYKTFQLMFAGKVKSGFMGPLGMIAVNEQNIKLHPFNTLFLAMNISMFLALFNLLPIPLPLLDGGWIVILLLERLLRREFTGEQKAMAQMVGLAIFIILGIIIAFSDIRLIPKRFGGG